jgi:histidine triad (HIT) family protein
MTDCIFCRIIRKEIPSKIVYEDEYVLAIEDIHPQAPVHILAMPKKHIQDILGIGPGDGPVMLRLFEAIGKAADIKGIKKNGFRVIANYGKAAGQTVEHLHFHILGGKSLGEKII